MSANLISVDYEVFGNVQGFDFLKPYPSQFRFYLASFASFGYGAEHFFENKLVYTSKGEKELVEICELYAEEKARRVGVVGWVRNSRQGTVTGQVQGPEDKVNEMKTWLSSVGSPSSRIERADFSNEREISKLDFNGFTTRY